MASVPNEQHTAIAPERRACDPPASRLAGRNRPAAPRRCPTGLPRSPLGRAFPTTAWDMTRGALTRQALTAVGRGLFSCPFTSRNVGARYVPGAGLNQLKLEPVNDFSNLRTLTLKPFKGAIALLF
jgi:hypothetical protein